MKAVIPFPAGREVLELDDDELLTRILRFRQQAAIATDHADDLRDVLQARRRARVETYLETRGFAGMVRRGSDHESR